MLETNVRAVTDKVTERVSKMGGGQKLEYLRRVPGLIDLTNLSSSAKPTDIQKLCETASTKGTAAVCVNPNYTQLARTLLPTDRRVKFLNSQSFRH